MRITRDIDSPVPEAVKELAAHHGFRSFPAASTDLVTDEQVDRLRDELGI